jgi:hypothetical protein
MARKSVATEIQKANGPGSKHDVWLPGADCLTVQLDRDDRGFPPTSEAVDKLCDVILGLSKAAEIIADDLQAEAVDDPWRTGLALSGIADAISLHATLAQGINAEMHRNADNKDATA